MPTQTIRTASGNSLDIRTGDNTDAIDIGKNHVGDLTFGYSGSRTGNMLIGGASSTGQIAIANNGQIDVNSGTGNLFIRSTATTELRGNKIEVGVTSASGDIEIGTDSARAASTTIGNATQTGAVSISSANSVIVNSGVSGAELIDGNTTINGSSLYIGSNGTGAAADPMIQIGPASGAGTNPIDIGHFSSTNPINVWSGGATVVYGATSLDLNSGGGSGPVTIGGIAAGDTDVTIGSTTNTGDVSINTAGTLALENTHATNGIEFKTDTIVYGKNASDTTTITTLGGRLELNAGASGIIGFGFGDSGIVYIGATNTRTRPITIGHQDNSATTSVYGQNVELRGKSGTTIGHATTGNVNIANVSTRTADVNIGHASANGDVNISSADTISLVRGTNTSVTLGTTLAMEGDTGINIGLSATDTNPIRFGGGSSSSRDINFFTGGTVQQVGQNTSIRCDGGAIDIRGDNGTEDIEIASETGTTSSNVKIGNVSTRTGTISIGHASATGNVNIDSGGTISIHGQSMAPHTATFTPQLIGTTTGIFTMTSQIGRVVYYGAMMHISVHIDYTSINTATGNVEIANLPTFATEANQIYRFTVGNATAFNKTGTEMIEIKHHGSTGARAYRNGTAVTVGSMDTGGGTHSVNFSGWLVRA